MGAWARYARPDAQPYREGRAKGQARVPLRASSLYMHGDARERTGDQGEIMRAIRIHQVGGPEVLQIEDIELPAPGPGQAQVRNAAIGVNYLDVYFRTGLYSTALPFTPGAEGSGEVTAVGSGRAGVQGRRPGGLCHDAGRPTLRRATSTSSISCICPTMSATSWRRRRC